MKILNMARGANMLINQVLEVKKSETVLIITDTDRPRIITEALAYSAESVGAEVSIVIMKPQSIGGEEPSLPVAAAMAHSQVIINQATYSLTHTEAARQARKNGARIANLRNFTEDMMVHGGINADYRQVRKISENLAQLLTTADEIRLTTQEGTDLLMKSAGREAIAQTGIVKESGQISGLPDGESTLAPLEGTTEGVIVSPYIADILGEITEPFQIKVTKGRIIEINGGLQALQLEELLSKHDENGYNAASQFALGTNPACRIIPNTREVSKKLGTAHIAIGDNRSLGGNSPSSFHIDFVFLKPSIYLDGRCIMENGEFLLDFE